VLVAEDQVPMRRADRESLLPAVENVLRGADVPVAALARVVCGAGPGSFTSLRIAASIAKGIAYAREIALDAVPSLALIVAGGATPRPGSYLACLDALRGQAFAAGYVLDEDGGLREIHPLQLVAEGDVAGLAASIGATLIGPGRAVDAQPHARGALKVQPLGARAVDLAGWEPVYGRLAEAQAVWEAAHGRSLPRL
jgi:tRNA threonylcarbamoyladenosine biosynthesis protein TsaB